MHTSKVLHWGARIVAALILLQTLFFKFSGAEESVYIFSTVGMEPWGRIGVGVMELIASVMLLITPIAWMGALIAVGLMVGAMGMHLTLLGIEVQGDGGYLFILAVVVAVCGAIVLWQDQEKALAFVKKLID
ncbi:MAG TPA: DoxX family protein [Cyclobacteriaceae bacterium]|nr:DoxX family protein [Cyclobacteriaceae bacterium]